MKNMGYVYILTNRSCRYGWFRRKLIKIGQTSKFPDERAKELDNTSVPTPFEVAYYIQSDRYEEIEMEMHRKLGVFRLNKNREFFKYPVRKAIKLLDKLKMDFSSAEGVRLEPELGRVTPGPKSTILGVERSGVSDNYTPKLGVNGDSYWSEKNGFQSASDANGISAAIPMHVDVIIANDELELRVPPERLESEIEQLQNTTINLESERTDVEALVKSNQEEIAAKQQLITGLNSISELDATIADKIESKDLQQVRKAELESELKRFPEADSSPKRRQLRLYRVYGILCVILILALYFFYVSALDKAFFSTLDLSSTDMTSFTRLNEIFDPTAVIKTFKRLNFWLVFAPFFPLALALAIHFCLGYTTKNFEVGKKFWGILWVFALIGIVVSTFVLDSILALLISKKIHDSAIILGIATDAWTIIPTNPFTWDLNIYIVLFFGFVVSIVLGLLFHVTIDQWTEARTGITDDRDAIEKELRSQEAEIKNLDADIERHSDNLSKAKLGIENVPDTVLIKAEIDGLDSEIRSLTEKVESDQKRIVDIQSNIVQNKNAQSELHSRIGKVFIDLVTLRRHIATFMDGWTTYLASKNDGADTAIKDAQEVAEETLGKYIQSRGIRWESR